MGEKKNERKSNSLRREQLLEGALNIIRREGITCEGLLRDAVAKECNVGLGTVNFAYGTIGELRNAVYKHAIINHDDESMLRVIAGGLIAGNEIARSAPQEVKQQALASLI